MFFLFTASWGATAYYKYCLFSMVNLFLHVAEGDSQESDRPGIHGVLFLRPWLSASSVTLFSMPKT